MARFLMWSDLHLECADFEIPPRQIELGIEAILIAGDIDVRGRHVDFLARVREIWQVPVLAVAGNHDPYRSRRFQKHEAEERRRLMEAQASGIDINVLRMKERLIGDTRIIGATLWTDMNLWPEMAAYVRWNVKDVMNDYRWIRWYDERTGIYRKMAPEDSIAMHVEERDYIMSRLDARFDGRALVMSHHLPVPQMLPDEVLARRQSITSAYASDLWHLIAPRRLDAWICGHFHHGREVVLEGGHGPVHFLSNMRGYPAERTRFDPLRVLDSNQIRPLGG
nr:metallophosphoesterase [Paracoccus saliphilus]